MVDWLAWFAEAGKEAGTGKARQSALQESDDDDEEEEALVSTKGVLHCLDCAALNMHVVVLSLMPF